MTEKELGGEVTESVIIRVLGQPAPQGSKRAFAIRRDGVPTGRVAVVEQQHKRVRTWRAAVIDAAVAVKKWPALEGPLVVSMIFYLQRPKSHYRIGRNADLLRSGAPALPMGMPDLDKLTRATGDALTDAGIWRDDAQVTNYLLAKRYADDGQLPGALITIREAR